MDYLDQRLCASPEGIEEEHSDQEEQRSEDN